MKPHSPLIIYIMLTRYSIILYFIQIHKMIKPDQRRYIFFILFFNFSPAASSQQPSKQILYIKTPVRTLTKINRVWENQREILYDV